MSFKDHIIDNDGNPCTAEFWYMRGGEAWYEISETGFRFAIPFDDMDGGTFCQRHKAIELMRWIRSAYEAQADARERTGS